MTGRFTRWMFHALIIAGVALPRSGLGAQACVFDTASVTSLHRLVIGLAPAGPDLAPAAGMDEVLWMADAIASHFKPPARMDLPLWARLTATGLFAAAPGATAPLGHGLDAFFTLSFRDDGRLANRDVRITSAAESLNEALRDAILAADSAGAIPALSDTLREAGGRARFRLVNVEGARISAVPLMRISVPEIRASSPVKEVKRSAVAFPRNALAANVSDSIDVEFVVDTSGRVSRDLAWPIRSQYLEFFEAFVEALERSTFEPARVGECRVPALVRQRAAFKVVR